MLQRRAEVLTLNLLATDGAAAHTVSTMRIVLTNSGTFGDINPLIGLAIELRRRGHQAVFAVPEMFRSNIGPLGFEFFQVRPNYDPSDTRLAEMIYDIKKGTERGLRELLFPAIKDSYGDLLAAVTHNGGADLLLTGELAYAGPIVAEVTGVKWASYVLAPFSFFSAYDPPVLPPYPTLARIQEHVPGTGHVVARFARWVTRDWPQPVYELRKHLGLKPGPSPIFDAKHSHSLVLAMFPSALGAPQPDWPAKTVVTGFVSYDGHQTANDVTGGNPGALTPALENFLAAGPPPLVFTLGTAAVLNAGDFYEQSAAVAVALNQRALLLVGDDVRNMPSRALPDTVIAVRYAPYSLLFRRASLIIHQGGVGATSQALAAGKPMLVVPYSHDQPDNARRVARMGVARVIRRRDYTTRTVERELSALLADTTAHATATRLGGRVAKEHGVDKACTALELLDQLAFVSR
ncbi:MAG TPA: glycosyltransferase [Acidisarcina sp.]